jgi:hypothetical protein
VAAAEGCGKKACFFGSGRVITWFACELRCPSAVTSEILYEATKETHGTLEDAEVKGQKK